MHDTISIMPGLTAVQMQEINTTVPKLV